MRDASGRFKDIQSYEKAHAADIKRKSKAETANAKVKAKPKVKAKKKVNAAAVSCQPRISIVCSRPLPTERWPMRVPVNSSMKWR